MDSKRTSRRQLLSGGAALAGVALGETVLARAARKAGIKFDVSHAHSAIYDAEKTAELFCYIVNRWGVL